MTEHITTADEIKTLRNIKHWAGELLARIHRDGGHHINDVGWEQAFLDADDRVVKWLGRDTEATVESLRVRLFV
jgi:hypothetical protein